MELKDINEVNSYYEKLNIKPCWDLDSLTIEELNIIANTFEGLHKIYPEVIIEEIGDLYSYDKEQRARNLIFGKKIDDARLDDEEYINKPEELKSIKKLMITLMDDINSHPITVDNEKYNKLEYSATYTEWSRNIKINHIYSWRANELICHEFGHAVAFQYDLNNDVELNSIFENEKGKIALFVSEYALTDVKEFIADIFWKYYGTLTIKSIFVLDVMEIINKRVIKGKAMTHIQRIVSCFGTD